MQLYTIGFAQKRAETFFDLLAWDAWARLLLKRGLPD
jgi:hypothetical protein